MPNLRSSAGAPARKAAPAAAPPAAAAARPALATAAPGNPVWPALALGQGRRMQQGGVGAAGQGGEEASGQGAPGAGSGPVLHLLAHGDAGRPLAPALLAPGALLPAASPAAPRHAFDHVRIHTDDAAAGAARALGAHAFASGSHLYFAQGQFDPGSAAGKRLLAHELTHVLQHDQGRLRAPAAAGLAVSDPADACEVEARAAEQRVGGGAAAQAVATPVTAPGAPSSATPSSATPSSATPSHGGLLARDGTGPAGGASGGGGASGSFNPPASGGAGGTGATGGTGGGSRASAPAVVDTEVVELRRHARFEPSAALAAAIDATGDAGLMVRVRYGEVAEGRIRVWRHPRGDLETVYANRPTARWPIYLHHPGLLSEVGPGAGDPGHSTESRLGVRVVAGRIEGAVLAMPVPSIVAGAVEGDAWLATEPVLRLLGWRGLQAVGLPTIVNTLQGGVLRYQFPGFRFGLDDAFDGSGDFSITDLGWRFEARAALQVQGLGNATLRIHRDEHGHMFGAASMQARMRGFDGAVDAVFGEGVLDIRGTVRFSRAPTLRGELGLHVADLETARATARSRVDAARPTAGAGAAPFGPPLPPVAAGPATTAGAPGGAAGAATASASVRRPRGVTGWGVLDYHFNAWLTGRAEVIASPDGYITSVGEIRPTAEVPFLDPPLSKSANVVPRQSVHVPAFSVAVADLGFGGSAQIDAQGAIGPGRLHSMAASGMFSTDPAIATELDISATMSLSAVARLLLHINGDVGVFVAGHSMGSVRAKITGDATLRAQVDVQPRIQRRPDLAGGAPQWVLAGQLRAGAQLSLGLKGSLNLHALVWDLHVIDLGAKRWNLGSVGIQANVSYVIGSGQRPQLSYDSIDFPAERFIQAVLNEEALPGNLPNQADADRPDWSPQGPGPGDLPPTTGEAAVPPVPALPPGGTAPGAGGGTGTGTGTGTPPDAGTGAPADAGGSGGSGSLTPDAGAGSGTAPPAGTTPPAAQLPQPVVAHPVMAGTTHTLTLTAETTPVLMFESDPGLLTGKIRRRVTELRASGPHARDSRIAAQIFALNNLGKLAEEVEREAIALETGWRQQGRRPPSDWRIPRSVPGFEGLVGNINSYATQFQEHDILPYAPDVAGSREITADDLRPRGDGRVLLLGEADFSFGVALLRQLGGSGAAVVATEVRSRSEVESTYGGGSGRRSASANVGTLQAQHVDVQFGVDATSIPASLGRFQVIVFNFPRMPEDSRGGATNNRAMLAGFFRSAAPRLAPDGRIFLSLSTTRYIGRWEPEELARPASLALESIRAAFHERNFPGYQHQMTHEEGSAGSRDSDYPGLGFVFRLR